MRRFAIGDIHGCYSLLVNLIEKMKPDRQDQIIFLGDYIAKGPDSKGVLDFLISLESQVDCKFLMGNHEAMFISLLGLDKRYEGFDIPKSLQDVGRKYFCAFSNGLVPLMQSYDFISKDFEWTDKMPEFDKLELPEGHVKFLANLDLYYRTTGFLCVHAGLPKHLLDYLKLDDAIDAISDDDYVEMLSTRNIFNIRPRFSEKIVHAHTPLLAGVKYICDSVVEYSWESNTVCEFLGKINIDTGSYLKNGKLTALSLDDSRTIIESRHGDA